MSKDLRLSTKMREHLATGIDLRAIFNEGGVGEEAELHLFPGSMPADADATEGATAIIQIVLPADAFGAFDGDDTIPKSGTWSATADNSATATWFRLYENTGSGIVTGASSATARIDGTVGTVAGQFNLVIDSVVFVATQSLTITTFDLIILSPITI